MNKLIIGLFIISSVSTFANEENYNCKLIRTVKTRKCYTTVRYEIIGTSIDGEKTLIGKLRSKIGKGYSSCWYDGETLNKLDFKFSAKKEELRIKSDELCKNFVPVPGNGRY